jgi:hypothetical protein
MTNYAESHLIENIIPFRKIGLSKSGFRLTAWRAA